MYKKLINPSEEKVSELLIEGYILHSVTPVYKRARNSFYDDTADLVYHFIKEVLFNKSDFSNILERYSTDFLDINGLELDSNINPLN